LLIKNLDIYHRQDPTNSHRLKAEINFGLKHALYRDPVFNVWAAKRHPFLRGRMDAPTRPRTRKGPL
jgi:hypothetical protein